MAEELLQEDDGKQEEELVIIEETNNGGDDDQRQLKADDELENASDEDREAVRERRRREKQERKERREKAMNRDKLELDFLRKRNDDLERRLSGVELKTRQADLNNLEAAYQEAVREAQLAEKVIAKAVEAGNGEDVAQAMRYRDAALVKAQQLGQYKQQFNAYTPPQPQPAEQVDNVAMEYAKEFIAENEWYDPSGKDEDSAIVLAIDNALVNEGYDPSSEEYWDELRRRTKRRLPDKFNTGGDRKPRGAPALGSGREHAPTSTRKEVYISAERKQALIDAGVWDDPVLRQRYVKKYMEYDRQHGRG